MQSFLILTDTVLRLFSWAIIIAAILSWLSAFNVINMNNRVIYMIADFLYRITEPLLRPIRRWVPYIGGIDISPIVLLLIIFFIRNLLREYGGSF